MKIAQDVLEVLDRAERSGNQLVLQGTLDRKLYTDVNKVLEAIGGKWSRGAKAHVFDMPVVEVLDPILETGEYRRIKQDFGQFDSPPAVVGRVIQLARIEPGMKVLEPNAGVGNIALAAAGVGAQVMCYEIDERRCDKLVAASAAAEHRLDMVVQRDFLAATPAAVNDRVVMNPPFAAQADVDHVLHAFKFLKPGGRLVAVMSGGTLFRNNKKAVAFREFVDQHGRYFERLPAGSFAASGTDVHACIVTLDNPGA